MPHIETVDEAFVYLNRLGLAGCTHGLGWIPVAQERLAKIYDGIRAKLGPLPWNLTFQRRMTEHSKYLMFQGSSRAAQAQVFAVKRPE